MVIKAENISRQYLRKSKSSNVFLAVKDTSMEISSGELIAVMGRSGSGKSTMLNMLAGMLTPTSGSVYVDDTDLYSLSDDERSYFRNCNIGVVPQGQTALSSLTVLENVMLPCMMYGAEDGMRGEAERLLELVGIGHLRDVYPNELSGGELRRMSIARAVIKKPGVLLADEPTGDLDDENSTAIFKLLRHLADDGMAVVLVTHEREAAEYADKVYKMNSGVLEQQE